MLTDSDSAGGSGQRRIGKVRSSFLRQRICGERSTLCGFSATQALRLMTIVTLDDAETQQCGLVSSVQPANTGQRWVLSCLTCKVLTVSELAHENRLLVLPNGITPAIFPKLWRD